MKSTKGQFKDLPMADKLFVIAMSTLVCVAVLMIVHIAFII